jgi:endo-chitodextinase
MHLSKLLQGRWIPRWRAIAMGACVWLLMVYAVPGSAQLPVTQFERAGNFASFFTADQAEARFVETQLSAAYAKRGVFFAAWLEPRPDTTPIYRFYNPVTLAHFYTADAAEKNALQQTPAGRGWSYEGIAFHAYRGADNERTPIHRFWDGLRGIHWYRAGPLPAFSPALPSTTVYEGIAFYGVSIAASNQAKRGNDAARLLTQATFGVQSASQVQALETQGYGAWLTEQFGKPQTSIVKYLRDVESRGERVEEQHPYEGVWQQMLFGEDQLRARMTFALSQIIVVSNIAPDQNHWAMAHWWDTLGNHAFGSYRQLLEAITLHPAMGYYLNMMGNQKEDAATHRSPNENFAREVLQLFSIGLNELNADGSVKRDASGAPIPAYDQKTVEALAKVFTGWSHGGNDLADAQAFFNPKENWMQPMQAWPAHHSPGAKTIFGQAIPAAQSPEADLKAALDVIANHPNVGPFIGKRLIQAMVTSNPSPAYIARVTTAFNNNGSGVRGDMKALIRAVLLDEEARNPRAAEVKTFGKQREPVLRFTQLMRAMNAKAENQRNSVWWLDNADDSLGQSPLLAPSVFNFFSPNFTRAGAIAQAGLVAPEFQITTETQIVGSTNFLHRAVFSGGFGYRDEGKLKLDFSAMRPLEADPVRLVDALALLLTNGQLSDATRNVVIEAVTKQNESDHWRTKTALVLLLASPDFVIQR